MKLLYRYHTYKIQKSPHPITYRTLNYRCCSFWSSCWGVCPKLPASWCRLLPESHVLYHSLSAQLVRFLRTDCTVLSVIVQQKINQRNKTFLLQFFQYKIVRFAIKMIPFVSFCRCQIVKGAVSREKLFT